MEALYLLVPISVLLVGAALWIFFVAADGGQFDDLDGPAQRILQDHDGPAGQTHPNRAADAAPEPPAAGGDWPCGPVPGM